MELKFRFNQVGIEAVFDYGVKQFFGPPLVGSRPPLAIEAPRVGTKADKVVIVVSQGEAAQKAILSRQKVTEVGIQKVDTRAKAIVVIGIAPLIVIAPYPNGEGLVGVGRVSFLDTVGGRKHSVWIEGDMQVFESQNAPRRHWRPHV